MYNGIPPVQNMKEILFDMRRRCLIRYIRVSGLVSLLTFRQVSASQKVVLGYFTFYAIVGLLKRGHRILEPESQVKYLIGVFARAGKFTEGYQGGPLPFFVR